MKRFLTRLFFVIGPFVFVLSVIGLMAYKSELKLLKYDLTCPTNILAAVVGDSRVEVSFDTDEIPWLQNFGLSAAPFLITAHKARLIAELNPHIRLIMIDIWPDKFFSNITDADTDNSFIPDGFAVIEMMTRTDMPPLDDRFQLRFVNGVLKPWLKKWLFMKDNRNKIIGGFARNKKFLSDYLLNDIDKIPFGPPSNPVHLRQVPTDGEIILEHLLDYFAKNTNHINIVLTATPILWYKERYAEDAREYYEKRMVARISERNKLMG